MNIFSYYQDEYIEQLLSLSLNNRSEKQEDTLSFFSDWHKDVYGYRPRGLDNECQYLLDKERNKESAECER